MSARYTVQAWAAPGVLCDQSERSSFGAIVVEGRRMQSERADVTLAFGNLDRCDIDTNGLSEDERETLMELGLA